MKGGRCSSWDEKSRQCGRRQWSYWVTLLSVRSPVRTNTRSTLSVLQLIVGVIALPQSSIRSDKRSPRWREQKRITKNIDTAHYHMNSNIEILTRGDVLLSRENAPGYRKSTAHEEGDRLIFSAQRKVSMAPCIRWRGRARGRLHTAHDRMATAVKNPAQMGFA